MIASWFLVQQDLSFRLHPLRIGLHDYWGTWLRYNSLEWNNHYSGHPALHPTGQLKLFKSLQAI
jgi:hypothetical protein